MLCDLLDLLESLSYIPADLTWDDDKGTFTVNDNQFVASIRPATDAERQTFLPFFTSVPLVGNLEFSAVLPDKRYTQDTTDAIKTGVFKVFGGVAYVAEQLIHKHQYQIVLCIAKRTASPTKFSNRVEAYRNIIPRIVKNIGWNSVELVSTDVETVFAAHHPKYSNELKTIKQHLSNHLHQ